MLATLGDLVEDVVIRVDDPVNVASDTDARIERRRGGSAANVASVAARSGHRVRFLGQVGAGPVGDALLAELAADGVDVSGVRRGGRVATVAVLVDPSGERTMLSDRGGCIELTDPDEGWLDGVTTFHVPLYSLAVEPLATSARTMIRWGHDRDIDVSIDLSSVSVIQSLGVEHVRDLLEGLCPAVVLANREEASVLAIDGPVAGAVTVIKQGGDPAIVYDGEVRHEVPARRIELEDTTGAGDAFAAGFLARSWRTDLVAACRAGHEAARSAMSPIA
ncbi:MAG: sugar kinase [Ilumatobacter sp.]|nr:sugar kinase [Ilumatobacter sp.]